MSPRLGLTYALDEGRKTLLRASFARYSGQLPTSDGGWDNPLGTTFLEYDWSDANGDGVVQIGEADLDNVRNFSGVDPSDPGGVAASPHEIDPDYHSNKDTEIVAGLERELVPNLAVSAAYTWRKSTDLTATQLLSGYYWYSWIGVTSADYHLGTPVTANGFTATPYVVNDGVADRITRRVPAPQPPGLQPHLPGPGAVLRQAAGQQLDGARGLLASTTGRRASGRTRSSTPPTTTSTRRSTAGSRCRSAPARGRTTTPTRAGR